jgi:hypothetical protein
LTYCIHDMDPAYCAVCNGAEKRAAATEATDRRRTTGKPGPWFPARWDGKCSACGEEFGAGDEIRSDGDSGWLCPDCGVLEP